MVLAVHAGCQVLSPPTARHNQKWSQFQAELAVFLFAIAAGLNTLTVPGCKSSMLDIAPDYSGIIFGVSNTLSNVPGFVAPTIVGYLLTDYSDSSQWQAVFWIR